MEDAQPAPPTEEAGAADDRGEAPEARGHVTWGLPAHDEHATCPKCAAPDGNFQITYHQLKQIRMVQHPLGPQLRTAPCIAIPDHRFPDGYGGEHLCIMCLNCRFSWVARVADEGSVYHRSDDE